MALLFKNTCRYKRYIVTCYYIQLLAIIMKKFKQSSLLILLMTFSYCTYGQQTEKSEYVFKMDEIAAKFEANLKEKKVDTLMQAYYFFDNGRGAKATKLFFWTHDGKSYVKAIRNNKTKKAKEFDLKECPQFPNIVDYYFKNSKAMFSSLPKPSILVSHNYGYIIDMKISDSEYQAYLRDEKRINNKHPLSEWINMIAEVAEPYIMEK